MKSTPSLPPAPAQDFSENALARALQGLPPSLRGAGDAAQPPLPGESGAFDVEAIIAAALSDLGPRLGNASDFGRLRNPPPALPASASNTAREAIVGVLQGGGAGGAGGDAGEAAAGIGFDPQSFADFARFGGLLPGVGLPVSILGKMAQGIADEEAAVAATRAAQVQAQREREAQAEASNTAAANEATRAGQVQSQREREAVAEKEGGAGGGGNGGGSCFAPWTPVGMADGSTKFIEDIEIGDDTAGGTVTGVMKFAAPKMYAYAGVVVSGEQAVLEGGKWTRVEDSLGAGSVAYIQPVVHDFDCTEHRIYVGGVTFSDYSEVQEGGTELDALLETLNETEAMNGSA